MAEITKEEMKKWLLDFDRRYYEIGLHHSYLVFPPTKEDKEMFKAIMDAIENMNKPKVSREFVERWREELAAMYQGLSEYSWNNFMETMLAELGHEIEEEKG